MLVRLNMDLRQIKYPLLCVCTVRNNPNLNLEEKLMKTKKLFTVSAIAIVIAGAVSAENVLRWTSQGDALTIDPHSQNESPTIAFNGINTYFGPETF